MRTTITGTIHRGDFETLKQLMRDQSSCKRYAYQRIHKDMLIGNDIKIACKSKYMSKLNQRYIADAVLKANMIKRDNVLFGGKGLWKKLRTRSITKIYWRNSRDLELYSRGDKTKSGNPNIRVIRDITEGYKLRVTLPGNRNFIIFKLYIPNKFKDLFEQNFECYDVRIKHKDNKFYVYIGLNIPEPNPTYKLANGSIGVDTNPDGLAVVVCGKDGNLLSQEYLKSERLQFARSNKRKGDVEDLALKVINKAIIEDKGIVIEDLKFNNKPGNKKFNRMRHNFIYAQLLQAIERRSIKDGVEIKKINPAFTSKVGILKYQDQYSLNRHTAAALVIARRGLGICEKIRVKLEPLKKDLLNLAGRDRSIALTKKAYSYFKSLYQVFEVETPAVTPPCLTPPLRYYGTG